MKVTIDGRRRIAGAIRPLDIAAVACVVAVLAVLTLLGGNRFRERARRLRCQANLEQLGKSLHAFAGEHEGQLPDCTQPRYAGPQWPWDIHTNLVHDLELKGATRDAFYCPANPELNNERHWNFWRGAEDPVRIIGYGMLFRGIRQVPRNLCPPDLKGNGQVPPAQAELMFDATASQNDDFTQFTGLLTDRSNHLRGQQPLGGNILFLDQHVEWRDFSKMQVHIRTAAAPGPVSWSY